MCDTSHNKHGSFDERLVFFVLLSNRNMQKYLRLAVRINVLEVPGIFKAGLQGLLSQCISFPAYPDRIVPQLCTEDLFDKHDGLKGPDVGTAEQMMKSPPYALPGHTEGLVYLVSVGSFENHVARLTRLELHPQVF